MQTRRRSALGCCSAEITRAIENGASALRLVLDLLDLEPDHGELVGELFQRLVGVEMFLQPGEREFHGLCFCMRPALPLAGEGWGGGASRDGGGKSRNRSRLSMLIARTQNLNQTKTLAHQHHVFVEPAHSPEIIAMSLAPVGEASVAFAALHRRKPRPLRCNGGNSPQSDSSHAGRLCRGRPARSSVRPGSTYSARLRWSRSRLYFPDHKVEQLVGEFRSVAERERPQTLIFLGDSAHELNPPASVGTSSGLKP